KGRIVNVTCEDSKIGEQAKNLFFKPGLMKPLSRNADVLSELGFGVNRSIERFHGSPIFDEKMFGTIHVAFGRNDQLGGKIKGFSHHDLTVLRPSVFFDCPPASPVIENRRFILSEREIELDWSELKPHLERHWRISPSGLH